MNVMISHYRDCLSLYQTPPLLVSKMDVILLFLFLEKNKQSKNYHVVVVEPACSLVVHVRHGDALAPSDQVDVADVVESYVALDAGQASSSKAYHQVRGLDMERRLFHCLDNTSCLAVVASDDACNMAAVGEVMVVGRDVEGQAFLMHNMPSWNDLMASSVIHVVVVVAAGQPSSHLLVGVSVSAHVTLRACLDTD